jgi:hypothetical protein
VYPGLLDMSEACRTYHPACGDDAGAAPSSLLVSSISFLSWKVEFIRVKLTEIAFVELCTSTLCICSVLAPDSLFGLLQVQDSGCPCFKGGPRTMQNLRKRFHLSLTEEVQSLPKRTYFHVLQLSKGISFAIVESLTATVFRVFFLHFHSCVKF